MATQDGVRKDSHVLPETFVMEKSPQQITSIPTITLNPAGAGNSVTRTPAPTTLFGNSKLTRYVGLILVPRHD